MNEWKLSHRHPSCNTPPLRKSGRDSRKSSASSRPHIPTLMVDKEEWMFRSQRNAINLIWRLLSILTNPYQALIDNFIKHVSYLCVSLFREGNVVDETKNAIVLNIYKVLYSKSKGNRWKCLCWFHFIPQHFIGEG